MQFKNATITAKANVYFDGKVVSHAVILENGEKKTIGTIFPGEYKFNTSAAERMEIIAGKSKVCIDSSAEWIDYNEGTFFDIPADSSFKIKVESGITEYVCSYI